MNLKHQLKRQLRDAEAALAPFISRLAGEGTKAMLSTGQNGSIGVITLAMRAPSIPEIAGSFAAKVTSDLAELGLRADHEIVPIPGSTDEVGFVFSMILKPPASAH